MKNLFIIIPAFILSLLSCLGGNPGQQPGQPVLQLSQPEAVIPDPFVQELIDEVNQERILTDLRRLTGEEPICISSQCKTIQGRETGTQDLAWAEEYVKGILLNLNYPVEVLNWARDSYHDKNILAHKTGLLYPEEEIYFVAHLDGKLSNNPAADDDASGVVALLELARILSHHVLSRSVTLFFSTGEEHGALGASQFVADYPERISSIKYLITLEMFGYDSNGDGKMEFWSPEQNTDFQKLLSDVITAYPIGLVPEVVPGCT